MSIVPGGESFYFFDFDDNIMFLKTPILLRNTVTKAEITISTGEFADIQNLLGKPGKWEDYAIFEGTFSHFRDIPAAQLKPGEQQYFVKDVTEAAESDPDKWKGPSWKLFVHACEKQRLVSIVTARGHHPDTLKAGVEVLIKKGLIAKLPNYHTVFAVGNDDVRHQLGDTDLTMTTPALKKAAIKQSVERAIEAHGAAEPHRFGMSDDDPNNVRLIITAMRECKIRHPAKRFFVIDTNYAEKVKLEVFPVDIPVTGKAKANSLDLV